MFGWEIVQLGRLAAGERWQTGHWSQSTMLHRGGRLCWLEQAELAADSRLRDSPLGLAGRSVFATGWASSPAMTAAQTDAIDLARTVTVRYSPNSGEGQLHSGVTWLPAPANLLLLRVLGQTAGQNTLRRLALQLPDWIAEAATITPIATRNFSPMLAILASRHEPNTAGCFAHEQPGKLGFANPKQSLTPSPDFS